MLTSTDHFVNSRKYEIFVVNGSRCADVNYATNFDDIFEGMGEAQHDNA